MRNMRFLVAAGALAAFVSICFLPGPTGANSTLLVGVDAISSGNSERALDEIDECVEASPGEQATIDVFLADPGMASAGLSGFEFRLYFDPAVVSVRAENPRMLLTQASGSSLFPVSSQLPNHVGEYLSVALDFGRRGVEPAGSSETTGGVISRFTLQAEGMGESNLRLQRVSLVNDSSEKITPEVAEPARIVVGGACVPPHSTNATPPPAGSNLSGQDSSRDGSAGSESEGDPANDATNPGNGYGGQSSSTGPGVVPSGGGPPGPVGGGVPAAIPIGAALVLMGLFLIRLALESARNARSG